MVPFSAMRMPATERGRAVVERILASATEQFRPILEKSERA